MTFINQKVFDCQSMPNEVRKAYFMSSKAGVSDECVLVRHWR